MLTLQENQWNFETIKIYSALNLFPVEIDTKTGKIQRQLRKTRLFLSALLSCLLAAHFLFMLGRLIQSTILEPEKYFRWDHFVVHLVIVVAFLSMYSTGFFEFVVNPGACVMIYNQLFVERENPVQKMMDEELQQELERKWEEKEITFVPDREVQEQCQSPHEKIRKKMALNPKCRTKGAGQEQEPEQQEKEGLDAGQISDLDLDVQEKFGSGSRVRPLLAWPSQYSLDEILARTYPFIMLATGLNLVVTSALTSSSPQLLYSCLSPQYQNPYSFIGLCAVEATVILCFIGFCIFSESCQLLFFGKCQLEFKQLDQQLRELKGKFQSRPITERDMRREIWILRHILKEMRELVVFIELFNCCFPFCIFAIKLCCLIGSILYYFFTIRHLHDFPFLAGFTGYIAVLLTLIYGILYQKAFSIPQKMERLKNEFMLVANKTMTTTTITTSDNIGASVDQRQLGQKQGTWAEMKREIGAIRAVGIKVGNFHTLERTSTPIFVDFVFQTVVSLLVTFPRK